jgi:hypothetical protein
VNPEPSHGTSGEIGKSNSSNTAKIAPIKEKPEPEKKSILSFFRHPFRKKPETNAEAERTAPCWKKPCPVCPPGESRNEKGACVAPVVIANEQCRAGQTWNGRFCAANDGCQQGDTRNGASCGDVCARYEAQAAAAANELRDQRGRMQSACSQGTGGECSEVTEKYDEELTRYRAFFNEAPAKCRALLPDPNSL